jgi:hypothetical protein
MPPMKEQLARLVGFHRGLARILAERITCVLEYGGVTFKVGLVEGDLARTLFCIQNVHNDQPCNFKEGATEHIFDCVYVKEVLHTLETETARDKFQEKLDDMLYKMMRYGTTKTRRFKWIDTARFGQFEMDDAFLSQSMKVGAINARRMRLCTILIASYIIQMLVKGVMVAEKSCLCALCYRNNFAYHERTIMHAPLMRESFLGTQLGFDEADPGYLERDRLGVVAVLL